MALPTDRQRTSVTEYVEAILPSDRRDEMLLPLPPQIKPERFIAGLQAALLKNPALMAIHPTLVRNEVIQWVSRGLSFDPYFGEVYLIIRRDFKKQRDVPSAMIGVNGLLKLARQSGVVSSVTTEAVHEHDTFNVSLGLHRDLIHIPELSQDPGPVRFVYAVARVEGEPHFRVMGMAEVEKHREVSDGWKGYKAGRIKSTPWADWPEAMAKKTVLRALLKNLPQSSELAEILRRDDESDFASEEEPPRRTVGRPPRLAVTNTLPDPPTLPPEEEEPEEEPQPEEPEPEYDVPPPEEPPPADVVDAEPFDPETGEIYDDGEIDRKSKDFLRGQGDQRAGITKILSTSIRNDPARFAHWKAGYDDAAQNG